MSIRRGKRVINIMHKTKMQLDENNLKIIDGKLLDLHHLGSLKTSSLKTTFWLQINGMQVNSIIFGQLFDTEDTGPVLYVRFVFYESFYRPE